MVASFSKEATAKLHWEIYLDAAEKVCNVGTNGNI